MNNEELEKEIEVRVQKKEAEAQEKPLSEEEMFRIQQEAQAKAVVDVATENPKALVKAEISQTAMNLVRNDEKFKQKINKAGENTAQSAIDEVAGSNRKSNNSSYYTGREEAINSMGGSAETSKDKQKYMNWIYTAWWYIVMTLLGIFFIAPLKVLLNWGLALSPEQTTRTIGEDGKETIEKNKKLNWVAGLFATVFYLAYLALWVWLGFIIFA